MFFLQSRAGGVFGVWMMFSVAIMGVTVGAEADSRAEIEQNLGETPEIDWDEQHRTSPTFVPQKYTEPLEVDVLHEPTGFEQQYKAFAQGMLSAAFTLAYESAMFGYTHSGVFGHVAVQKSLEGVLYISLLGVLGLQARRVIRVFRGGGA